MTLVVGTYLVYLVISLALTVWVARTDGLLRIDLAQRTSLPPARAPFLSEVRGVGGKKRLDLPQLASLSSDQRDLRLQRRVL